jgi:AP-3 complex subunit beta
MAGLTTSSKALIYFSERVEDATEAVKGLIGGSGSAKYLDTLDERTSVIRSQLESDRDDLRLEGLRTIVALLSKGRDASIYFPSVLKLTSNSNLEIKKMVYIIVRRYAKRQPDVALLGINSFQRDLLDRSEIVRAMALRVLSGLRLPLVASVVEVAIAKSVKDPHFYVRKGAALAIVKCHHLAPHTRSALKGHLSVLLNDRHPAVLSTALVAFAAVSPTDFEMLHQHYRKLCHALSDMDEWGQRNAIEVLGLYARRCIARPLDGKPLDVDLQLLFAKTEDLLMSRNAVVVTAAVRLLLVLAPAPYHTAIARPLLRLTRSSPGISYFALVNCYFLAQTSPSLLSPHVDSFILKSPLHEASHISRLKLKILVQLADSSSWKMALTELSEQARCNSNDQVSQTAVQQIGTLARKDVSYTQDCTRELLKLVKDCNDRDLVVGAAVDVLRRLLQSQSDQDKAIIVSRLSSLLFTAPSKKTNVKKVKLVGKGTVKSGLARSCIYWLLGQYCRLEVDVTRRLKAEGGQMPISERHRLTLAQVIGTDILRRAAINFTKEDSSSKLHIITLSSKLVIFLPSVSFDKMNSLKQLHSYIMQLARYDEDFDVRDRGRLCRALIDRVDSAAITQGVDKKSDGEENGEQLGGVILRRDQVLHILFEGKVTSSYEDASTIEEKKDLAAMDSLSYAMDGTKALSNKGKDFCSVPWSDDKDLPPSSVRQPALFATSTRPGLLDGRNMSSESLDDTKSEKSIATTTTRKPESSAAQISLSSGAKYKDLDAFLEEESEKDEEEEESEGEVDEEEEDDEEDDQDEEAEEEEDDQNTQSSDSSEEESDEESDEQENPRRTIQASLLPAALEEQNEWAR